MAKPLSSAIVTTDQWEIEKGLGEPRDTTQDPPSPKAPSGKDYSLTGSA